MPDNNGRQPYYAQPDPNNPSHITVYETNGSDNPDQWTPVCEGDLKDGQSLEGFREDFENGEGELDNVNNFGQDMVPEDGPPGGPGPGNLDDPAAGPPGDDDGPGPGDDDGPGPGDDEPGDDGPGEDGPGEDGPGEDGYGLDEEGDDLDSEDVDESGDLGDEMDENDDEQGNIQEAIREALAAAAGARREAAGLQQAAGGMEAGLDDLDQSSEDLDRLLADGLDGDPFGSSGDSGMEDPNMSKLGGDPVALFTGAYVRTDTDIALPARGIDFVLSRHYCNQSYAVGCLGPKWLMVFEDHLVVFASGRVLRVTADATPVVYEPDGQGEFRSPDGWDDVLERRQSGWQVRNGFGVLYLYDTAGQLTEIRDRYNNCLVLQRSGGLVTAATDPSDRTYSFSYSADGLLSAITTGGGLSVAYEYSDGRLDTVSYVKAGPQPYGESIHYRYGDGDDPRLRNNLEQVCDCLGTVLVNNEYGTSGFAFNRVVSQQVAGAFFGYQYTESVDEPVYSVARVTDRRGNLIDYTFDSDGLLTRAEQRLDGGSQTLLTTYEYGATGLLTRVSYPLGNQVELNYDLANTDFLARTNLLQVVRRERPESAGTTQQFQYGPHNQVSRIVDEMGATTDMAHDAYGSIVRVQLPETGLYDGTSARPLITFDHDRNGLLKRRVDPNGLVTDYEYWDTPMQRGLLRRTVAEPAGAACAHESSFDELGNPTREVSPSGSAVEYHTDARGRVASVYRNGVLVERRGYDRLDRLVSAEMRYLEPDGRASVPEWVRYEYEYDLFGRLTESRVVAGTDTVQAIAYGHDDEGNIVSIVGPGDAAVRIDYDERNLPISVETAPGTPVAASLGYEYDANGNLVAVTDGRGATCSYQCDGFGRITGTVDPLGQRESCEYDRAGRMTRLNRYDAGGILRASLKFGHSSSGKLLSRAVAQLSPSGSVTRWLSERVGYDLEGNAVERVSATGLKSVSTYDRFGREVQREDPLGNKLLLDWDANSLLTRATRQEQDGDGQTRTFEQTLVRDLDGRVICMTDSTGREETMAYDSQGYLKTVKLADGVSLEVEYDPLGRPVRNRVVGTDPGQQWEETISYSQTGLPVGLTDAMGRQTSLVYDQQGRLQSVNDPLGHERMRFAYDENSNQTSLRDARGVVVTQSFDALNRLTRRDVTRPADIAGASWERFEYDSLGSITVAESDQSRVDQSHNSLGLLTSATMNGATVTRTFGATGVLSELRYPSGLRLSPRRDALGRISGLDTAVVAANQFPGRAVAGTLVSCDYIGRELRRSTTYRSGVTVTNTYDELGRPLLAQALSGGQPIRRELTLRDSLDRVRLHYDTERGAVRFSYDARAMLCGSVPVDVDPAEVIAESTQSGVTQARLDQLAAMQPTNGVPSQAERDAAGNLIRLSESGQVTTYAVNSLDQVTSVDGDPIRWDAAGNLKDDGLFLYQYDYANRLCLIAEKASGQPVYSATYDPFGRLIAFTAGSDARRVVYDGEWPIEHRNAAGQPVSAMVWAAGNGELVMLARDGQNLYPIQDLHGNVTVLTDDTGGVVQTYQYGMSGRRTVSGGPAGNPLSPFGYLGRMHVPGTALVGVGARYLHSGLGTFISPDPSGYSDGLNLYQYAAGNPVSFADYSGESATVVGAALGFAWGMGWAVGSMINDGLIAGDWKGIDNYASQVAQFTAGGTMIGAAVDLAPIGAGALSAALMGGGMAGFASAFDGSWGGFASDVGVGAVGGLAFWGLGKGLGWAAAPVARWAGGTAAGAALKNGVSGLLQAGRGSTLGSSAVRAWRAAENSVAGMVRDSAGTVTAARLVAPSMRAHLQRALAGQGVPAADMALMNQMHEQTMATLSTSAGTWKNWTTAYWKAARQTSAFNQLFPKATGTGAPGYGNLGRLNLHHLMGRGPLEFEGQTMVLVPNGLDTPFVHSSSYLTGTLPWEMRRGIRGLFPRQWLAGGLGAGAANMIDSLSDASLGPRC